MRKNSGNDNKEYRVDINGKNDYVPSVKPLTLLLEDLRHLVILTLDQDLTDNTR